MSRSTHPYFNPLHRRSEAVMPAERPTNARTPLAKPTDEPGVLWEPFRNPQPPA